MANYLKLLRKSCPFKASSGGLALWGFIWDTGTKE